MKRFLFLIVGLVGIFYTESIPAQRVCFNYRGEWGSMRPICGEVATDPTYSLVLLRTDSGLYYFGFNIPDYREPSKKERKRHEKYNIWYEYTGYVSYCVNDTYPTALDFAKVSKFVIPSPLYDETPTVVRETNCIIKIAPYKKHPELYTVFFDNIVVGVDITGLKFNFK